MEVTLAESRNLRLVGEFENVFVVERATLRRHDAGEHYGDAAVGIIGPDESWAATGGEGVIVWRRTGTFEYLRRGRIPAHVELQPGEFYAVTNMYLIASAVIGIQIDPESRLSSEWVLDIETGDLRPV